MRMDDDLIRDIESSRMDTKSIGEAAEQSQQDIVSAKATSHDLQARDADFDSQITSKPLSSALREDEPDIKSDAEDR
jgi:hypothetical protein